MAKTLARYHIKSRKSKNFRKSRKRSFYKKRSRKHVMKNRKLTRRNKMGGAPKYSPFVTHFEDKGKIENMTPEMKEIVEVMAAVNTGNDTQELAVDKVGKFITTLQHLSPRDKENATYILIILARNPDNWFIIDRANRFTGFEYMIQRLILFLKSDQTAKVREGAANAIVSFTTGNFTSSDIGFDYKYFEKLFWEAKRIIHDNFGFPLLINMVNLPYNQENKKMIAAAAVALRNLVIGGETVLHDKLLNEDGIQPLIYLAQSGEDGMKKVAAEALRGLAKNEHAAFSIAKKGGVPHLNNLVKSGSTDEKQVAAEALGNIMSHDVTWKYVEHAGCIQLLIELVKSGSDDEKNVADEVLIKFKPTYERRFGWNNWKENIMTKYPRRSTDANKLLFHKNDMANDIWLASSPNR